MKKIITIFSFIFITFFFFLIWVNIQPLSSNSKNEIFILDSDKSDVLALKLEEEGYIKSMLFFEIVSKLKINNKKIQPGGYYLSKNMNVFEIANSIKEGPDLKWVLIREGMRKEQIGEELQKILKWNDEELRKWNETYTRMKPEYEEGVYFPDKYLIPVDENGAMIAKRMIDNFNSKFEKYAQKANEKNIKWTTALKIASLIQREAGGPSDMPLISGVIWNRLLDNQKLDIDATIQYALGKRNDNWWSPVSGSDIRNTDSEYNTYKYKGLPPTPIANPGIAAIDAAINPEDTDCLFYLHDRSRQIHCSVTYEEHLENIEKYLN